MIRSCHFHGLDLIHNNNDLLNDEGIADFLSRPCIMVKSAIEQQVRIFVHGVDLKTH